MPCTRVIPPWSMRWWPAISISRGTPRLPTCRPGNSSADNASFWECATVTSALAPSSLHGRIRRFIHRAMRGARFAVGSRDSAHAAILPVHFLREAGLDPEKDLTLVRFDADIGKHGDTGTSEQDVVHAVMK